MWARRGAQVALRRPPRSGGRVGGGTALPDKERLRAAPSFSEGESPDWGDRAWALQQNYLMSDESAAALLQNHASMDWRDVLPRLDVPTLVITGEGSAYPAEGMREVGERIPGAKVVTFGATTVFFRTGAPS